MTKRGSRKILVGLILLTVHFNFGTIRILPAFLAWLMIWAGIGTLQEEWTVPESSEKTKGSDALGRARTMALCMVGYCLLGELAVYVVGGFERYPMMHLIWPFGFQIGELMIEFFLMEGIIRRLRAWGDEMSATLYEGRLRRYTIWFSLVTVMFCIFNTFYSSSFMTLTRLIKLLIRVWYILMVREIRNWRVPMVRNRLFEIK